MSKSAMPKVGVAHDSFWLSWGMGRFGERVQAYVRGNKHVGAILR